MSCELCGTNVDNPDDDLFSCVECGYICCADCFDFSTDCCVDCNCE